MFLKGEGVDNPVHIMILIFTVDWNFPVGRSANLYGNFQLLALVSTPVVICIA